MRGKTLAHQIEIGDAIDFLVIGDARVAIAKADLRPHIQFDLLAARLHGAAERASGRPRVARKRPRDFAPAFAVRPRMLVTGGAGEAKNRDGKSRQRFMPLTSPPQGKPPTPQ